MRIMSEKYKNVDVKNYCFYLLYFFFNNELFQSFIVTEGTVKKIDLRV